MEGYILRVAVMLAAWTVVSTLAGVAVGKAINEGGGDGKE